MMDTSTVLGVRADTTSEGDMRPAASTGTAVKVQRPYEQQQQWQALAVAAAHSRSDNT
jgi:hypothetical protein